MEEVKLLKNTIGNIDIYLLDQIIKNRYQAKDKILDAGCGNGRNIYWFYQNNFNIYGIDRDKKTIDYVKETYLEIKENFTHTELSCIPYQDTFFHHIISNAVLHFSESTSHFKMMFAELVRVLKVNGSLFIRMTSTIGIENNITEISEGVYTLPDGTTRFLITRKLIKELVKTHHLLFLEPLKTVNVNDMRCMTTLVFKKLK